MQKIIMNKHPDTSKEVGGLVINEKDSSNAKIGVDIIKGLSKKLASLKILDILNFSRPARLTSPLTVHQCCGNEWVRTDLLEKAYQIKNDPIERMKYLFAFAVSGVHQGPMICRSRAPFNPILGETFQAVNEKDGSRLYLEQTEHHPPTFNFSIVGPNKHFEYNGFGTIDAHLTNINVIKGERIGKTILKFDDGSLFTFTTLKTRINGIVMGERVYNYYGDLIIKDYKNKVECIMNLSDEVQQGMLSKMWYGKTNPQYDESIAVIKQVNPQTKNKDVKAKGYASWLGQVIFDDKTYWSIFDEEQKWTQTGIDFILPSDSTKREDLEALVKGNLDEAQEKKEKLEQLQREDQKKREAPL
jgi:hypothetical protein